MKDFNYYINLPRLYDIKIVTKRRVLHLVNENIEKALRTAYNLAIAWKNDVKILIRPSKCKKDVLYMQAFTLKRDGLLHDEVQNTDLDYIKQNGEHGCKRWELLLTK